MGTQATMVDTTTTMEDTTTSAAVMELVVIRWAVPTVEEHFQEVVPMVEERFQEAVPTVEAHSQEVDPMAEAASPLISDASSMNTISMWSRGCGPVAVVPRLRSRDEVSVQSQCFLNHAL